MSPVVIILKNEKSLEKRTIAFETNRKDTIVIIEQVWTKDTWVTSNHMSLPVVMFVLTQSFRFIGFRNKLHQRVYN